MTRSKVVEVFSIQFRRIANQALKHRAAHQGAQCPSSHQLTTTPILAQQPVNIRPDQPCVRPLWLCHEGS